MQSEPISTDVRISIKAMCTTLCDKVCQRLAAGRWFSPVSSTNKTDRHDITELLLKVALSTMKSNKAKRLHVATNPMIFLFWKIAYPLTEEDGMAASLMHYNYSWGYKKETNHKENLTIATMTWLTDMEYLCHKWPRICSTCHKHFRVLSSFTTYQHVCN